MILYLVHQKLDLRTLLITNTPFRLSDIKILLSLPYTAYTDLYITLLVLLFTLSLNLDSTDYTGEFKF